MLSPLAVMLSDFEQVLSLDADCYPARDPTFLFDWAGYRERGSIFWPDLAPFAGLLGPETWAVAASRIAIVSAPGLGGDLAEIVVTREGRTLTVDGHTRLGHAPVLERVGQSEGTEYVVRAERLDGDLWEVEATPL